MKKPVMIVLSALMCLNLAACGGEEECNHEYNIEVVHEQSYTSDQVTKKTCIYCDEVVYDRVPKLASPIEVTFTDMRTERIEKAPMILPDGSEIPQPDDCRIIFEMDVKNSADQNISGFSGSIIITEPAGGLNVIADFDEAIAAGETVQLTDYGFQVSYSDMTSVDNLLTTKSLEELDIHFELSDIDFE